MADKVRKDVIRQLTKKPASVAELAAALKLGDFVVRDAVWELVGNDKLVLNNDRKFALRRG